jgi:predicted Rossmann fold nucleotide-binding protein DprA/Smf involved in DNA uptake
MTFNPITALSEQLQKLINEHGSAAILRDHLALFKDQVILLEKENVNLRSENAILTSKVETLEKKNQELTRDNKELRSKIQKYEQPPVNFLDETKTNILKFLFKQNKLPADRIAESLGYEIQAVKFHLEELKANNMVSCVPTHDRHEPPMWKWSLAQEGRRYLIKNKLTS